MSARSTMPIQNELKLPAVSPDRMLSDGPPSLEEVTTSCTWPLSVDVNTLMSSGMMAPASVPHVMMAESFHHWLSSPLSDGMSAYEAANVNRMDTSEVIHTSCVSGASKFIFSAVPKRALTIASLTK